MRKLLSLSWECLSKLLLEAPAFLMVFPAFRVPQAEPGDPVLSSLSRPPPLLLCWTSGRRSSRSKWSVSILPTGAHFSNAFFCVRYVSKFVLDFFVSRHF